MTNSSYDLVLIDDDPLVRALWTLGAKRHNKSILTLASPAELPATLAKGTPIFIDKRLANGECGIAAAKVLFARGYSNLYLATGDDLGSEPLPSFIKGIGGKDFPDLKSEALQWRREDTR